jgi:hypothetical protein
LCQEIGSKKAFDPTPWPLLFQLSSEILLMATVDSEEILNEIKQHAAALLLLSKTHGTVYQTWLGSLEYEKRQEWTQLVGLSGGKGRRRRKQVESLISQRGKTPNRPTPEQA